LDEDEEDEWDGESGEDVVEGDDRRRVDLEGVSSVGGLILPTTLIRAMIRDRRGLETEWSWKGV